MDEKNKCRDWTLAFLLIVSCLLTLWGIFGSAFDFFTGVKLVILLALGSMFGRVAHCDKAWVAAVLQYGCAALALFLGMHLLPPYFWPGRLTNIPLFGVFAVTAALAWAYLLKELWSQHLSLPYLTFCFLPPVLYISSFCSVKLMGGSLYAAGIFAFYYAFLALLLVAKSLAQGSQLYFNCGFLMLWGVITAVLLTVYMDVPLLGLFTCFGFSLLAFNRLFMYYWQRKGRKK